MILLIALILSAFVGDVWQVWVLVAAGIVELLIYAAVVVFEWRWG